MIDETRPEEKKPPKVTDILNELRKNPEIRQETVEPAGLDPKLAMLRQWQSQRLAKTHTDLLESPKYSAACSFILSDIYAPRDFSQRDYDLQRIHAFLSKILPPITLRLLTDSIELNHLTNALDQALLKVLVEKLGVTNSITAEQYAEAYRLCDNYKERLRQIEMTTQIIEEVGLGARLPLVSAAFNIARKPAIKAGWGELIDFLERGHKAFKSMKDAKTFAATIEQREKAILDEIYGNHENPRRP